MRFSGGGGVYSVLSKCQEMYGIILLEHHLNVIIILITVIHLGRVDPGGLGVVILASGSEVRGFDPGRGRWIFSECKNPEYDFLRKGSNAVGPVS